MHHPFKFRFMEEIIEVTAEKVNNSLDLFSLTDKAFILQGISDMLKKMSVACLLEEYGLTEEMEENEGFY